MNYATLADLQQRFGARELVELTDRDNVPPTTVDAALVATKIGDAQAFVDGYVGRVYRLPLLGCSKPNGSGGFDLVAPPVLTRLCCDLARYYLYDDLAPENEVHRRYKAAIAELEAIASGVAQLACPWGGAPGTPIGVDPQSGGSEETLSCFGLRAITDQTLRGFA